MATQPDTAGESPLLRKVAFAAGGIFALAAVSLSWLSYSHALEELADTAEQSALSLNRLFANFLWPGYAAFAAQASGMSREDIRAHERTTAMFADVRDLARGTRILKVKLFDRAGLTIFSSETAQIGTSSYTSPGLQAALDGRVDCKLEYRARFEATDGPVFDRRVVSCYMPIHEGPAAGAIAAIMEIYSDVTESHDLVVAKVRNEAAIGVAILAVAFLVLLAVVRHAERAIAREHRRNAALGLARAEAETASRTKSTFLANMSHELRTPLNAIIGFAEMIRGEIVGPVGNARYRTYAGHIGEAGQHLLAIINDVLDFTKAEAGKMRVDAVRADVGVIVRSVAQMVEPAASRAGVTLEVHAASGLPEAFLDASKLRQILLNLTGNAIKFTPKGGRVELAAAPAPGRGRPQRLRFEVRDTGVGMGEADIATALRPFGQVDNPMTRHAGGTGLGLPLAKEFAELMGGSLVIESEAGEGTTVIVEIPVGADPSAAAETSPRPGG
ncbi:MAG: hypothetical protein JNL71_15265 [Rhodospirillales bacterium]|nr:hypothetical protein [Rhodospirillales bacterium]